MNAFEKPLRPSGEEAKLHYGDGEFAILKPGRFVVCAVTGAAIPLENLRYWSVERQEAYAGPRESLLRWRELTRRG
jgi:hypothetical protein